MAKRTYIPLIRNLCAGLKQAFINYGPVLKERLGDGLYAAIQLVVDLCEVVVNVIDGDLPEGDPWQDFPPVNDLNSSQINAINAAVARFNATIGGA